jgi:hypothetical protein
VDGVLGEAGGGGESEGVESGECVEYAARYEGMRLRKRECSSEALPWHGFMCQGCLESGFGRVL